MSWYYRKFPCHKVASERYEIRGRNFFISYYHYRLDTYFGTGVCAIFHIPFEYPVYVYQIDINWLPNCDPSAQPRYANVENCYYKKILGHYNYWIIM